MDPESNSLMEIQRIISNLEENNSDDVIEQLNKELSSSQSNISIFSKAFIELIPARPTHFKLLVSILNKIPQLNDTENKQLFLNFILNKMHEPNQQEVCLFFVYLVENQFLSPNKANEYLYLMFEHSEKLDNAQFIQYLYPIFYYGKVLSTFPKFDLIMNELKLRFDNINLGFKLDENAELYKLYYQQIIDIQNSKWNLPKDFPCKTFLDCIMNDNDEMLQTLINQNVIDVNDTLEPTLIIPSLVVSFNPSLISIAAFYGSIKCLKVLEKNGADLSLLDEENHSSLDFAVISGNIELLQYVISKTKLDIQNAMITSIEFFRKKSFDFLLKQTKLTGRLMNAAAKVNNLEILKLLIDNKVPFEDRDEYYWTPLHLAASYNSIESLRILLKIPNINVNITDLDGETPLHCAAKEGYIETMEVLLNCPNIQINAKDREDATPLHWASCNDQDKAIKLLIKNKEVDVNRKDAFDRTPLILAAVSSSPKSTKALLECEKIDVNIRDKCRMTALIGAAQAKNLEIVKLISSAKGIDLNARNEDGLTALDVAAFNNDVEMVKYLLSLEGIEYKDLLKAEAHLSKEVNELIKSKQ